MTMPSRLCFAAIALAAAGPLAGAWPAAAMASSATLAMVCTNPASGAHWPILIDWQHRSVDGNPAEISASKIAWHNARDSGNYALDRGTGQLTVITASSTGGYFIYDRCRPAH
jgi:hypothetical protein